MEITEKKPRQLYKERYERVMTTIGIAGIAEGAKSENVKAMVDATFKYGVYRK